MDAKSQAKQIFLAGVSRVQPENIIRNNLHLNDGILIIQDLRIPLDTIENIFLVGAGKASAYLALEMETLLGKRISGGAIVVKYGHGCDLSYLDLLEAGHPVPDFNGLKATRSILNWMHHASPKDLVINLLSGGGSALLADLPDQVSLEEMKHLNQILLNCGASIGEINTVRKHLSSVKGGRLALACYPAQMVNLILSDVVQDFLDVIASGPTVPDPTTYSDALRVLRKYELDSKVAPSIYQYLQNGEKGLFPETPKMDHPAFACAHNFIIGNNSIALEAASLMATALGYETVIVTHELQGDTIEAARHIIETSIRKKSKSKSLKPLCLLFGGETTLRVKGEGLGGRNQHMALAASLMLAQQNSITFLAAGTDGTDGPTEAAGAIVDCHTVEKAGQLGIRASEWLENFDSYHFFEKAGGHLITGPTHTNVMDMVVILLH